MSIADQLKSAAVDVINELYKLNYNTDTISVNSTKPEFEGDYTIVLFGLVKELKKSPDELGHQIGSLLMQKQSGFIEGFNIIKGFLNLTIADSYWLSFLEKNETGFSNFKENQRNIVVEYSSPNTNKPLHLGHLRNNFLGWSIAEILKSQGNTVFKTCISNDRGIHICKSMVAWQKFGNGATPASTGIKGDHLVGDFYVLFEKKLKEQVAEQIARGTSKTDAEKNAPLMLEAQLMLRKWEDKDPDTLALWQTMNGWVYEGFKETYQRIGSDFDKQYYESETFLLGKEFVQEGLAKGIFYKKEDGSVWIDLTADGLDEKLVQRSDGTSVYITQDLGLAEEKYKDFPYDQSIYVIADEQNYHMKVLKLILQKLQKPYADGIYHLSYGMVELPSGRMKTREGTVVDADDLLDELIKVAAEKTEELGKVNDFSKEELAQLYDTIAVGALKFFLLRVDPKKRMVFNPEDSIDFHGFTGPFVQYTHARIKSILRAESYMPMPMTSEKLLPLEKELIVLLEQYTTTVHTASQEHNPSLIAIYVFNLAKLFNSFYAAHSIRSAESTAKKLLRLQIARQTAQTIQQGMALLGIRVPERM